MATISRRPSVKDVAVEDADRDIGCSLSIRSGDEAFGLSCPDAHDRSRYDASDGSLSPLSAMADSTDRWQTFTEARTAARDRAQYDDAERLFLLAGHETERFEADDARAATTLNNLGLVYHAQGQYARAKSYYEQALARWEQTFGWTMPMSRPH